MINGKVEKFLSITGRELWSAETYDNAKNPIACILCKTRKEARIALRSLKIQNRIDARNASWQNIVNL